MIRDEASERQVRAAAPQTSTWVAANAGSGKTRVLTDRVARLLLGGVAPQHILCLTYTKAAATEMQNRLFRLLGDWAMKPDDELRAALRVLGEEGPLPGPDLARARRLFARALETPGGLRIQTIHSFCAMLLRRFPLEASVSPGFRELDDRSARLLRAEIIEDMADRSDRALMAELAMALSAEDFAGLAEEVAGHRARFARPLDADGARQVFGVTGADDTAAAVLASVFLGGEDRLVAQIAPVLTGGGKTDIMMAQRLAALDLTAPGMAELAELEDLFLTGAKTKTPFSAKIGSLPTKDIRAALGPHLQPLEDWMARVETARPRRVALAAAMRTALLHRFAARFLPLYDAAKAARGKLDFEDLIQRTKVLLTDRSVAAWVLFRLDGGIDHILVDEAQDTAPDQWKIIELLAAEFTAGEGARTTARTLFVVGDKKQSIYSFQGADVAAFDRKQADFGDGFRLAGLPFQTLELEYSFRSSPAILRLVDETFGTRFPEAVGGHMRHIAHKSAMPGRVDLWPLIAPEKTETDAEWENPVDLVAATHHHARLAAQIAEEIAGLLAAGTTIPVDPREDARGWRPMRAGDVLILVQRRSGLFAEIIRACKKAGLPIAGADRLKLAAELAVKDLTSLLSFLATAEDDLALAEVLRSPLCGWSEDQLYRLAQPRKGYLWEALRNTPDDTGTLALLHDLRDQTDFLRPFELLDRVLTRHDGRRRLIARLGAEAEDGIDELLNRALAYETVEVPSLTGFLIWLETGEVEVKRQMDSAGDRIRVMTVHGAKGLEAPVVILPDTADREQRERDEILVLPDGPPVWKTPAEESPDAITAAREMRRRRQAEESLRLLYVALTRARVWLIICGAGEAKTEMSKGARDPLNWAWHAHVAAGMQAVGAAAMPEGRLRYQTGDWPAPAPAVQAQIEAHVALPGWAGLPAPVVAALPALLSPSALGGPKVLPGDGAGIDESAAMARGTALHLLLQYLPDLPRAQWREAARRLIGATADVMDEATRLLDDPGLAEVFGPGSLAEVEIAAPLDGQTLYGSIDRLIVGPDRVLAVDFKSNALVPALPEDVPEGVLRQLGAYAAALAQAFPGRQIDAAILWTRTGRLMPLPCKILRAALQRSAIP